MDDRGGLAPALDLRGLIALQQQDAPAATTAYRASLAVWLEMGGEQAGAAVSLAGAAGVALAQGAAAVLTAGLIAPMY